MSRSITRRSLLSAGAIGCGAAGLAVLGCTTGADPPQRTAFPAPTATPSVEPPLFPLSRSPDGRYLVDHVQRPFRIHGDSAQSMIVNLTIDEAVEYLDDRRAKGFNAINVNLLEHKFAVSAPGNRRGDLPFLTPGSFSTPNDSYFDFAEAMLNVAAHKGFLVSLAYIYLGYGGGDEGWWAELNAPANTQAVCYDFGRYLGDRLKGHPNLLWVVGGDYSPPSGSEGERRLHKMVEGLRAAGAGQLQAGDWNAPCLSTDELAFVPEVNVNAVYTYGPNQDGRTFVEARHAFDYSPSMPAYLKETGYEAEGWIAGDPASVRKYEYWALLGGATAGGFYGHRDIWGFATDSWFSGFKFGRAPWQRSLDAPGAYDWQRLGQLLDSCTWYDLVPSPTQSETRLVTEGGGKPGDPDYVVAATTTDGSTTLAYMPPTGSRQREIAMNETVLRSDFMARWFDPSTGQYAPAGGAGSAVRSRLPGLTALVPRIGCFVSTGSAAHQVAATEAQRGVTPGR